MISSRALEIIEQKGQEVCSDEIELLRWMEAVHFAMPLIERDAFSKMRTVAEMNESDAKRRVKHLPDYAQASLTKREKYFTAMLLGSCALILASLAMAVWRFI